MSTQLNAEKSRRSPIKRRWIDVGESPWSRAFTYKQIKLGNIVSVLIINPGARRGRRMLDGDSIDSFLENLAKEQAIIK